MKEREERGQEEEEGLQETECFIRQIMFCLSKKGPHFCCLLNFLMCWGQIGSLNSFFSKWDQKKAKLTLESSINLYLTQGQKQIVEEHLFKKTHFITYT